MQVRTRTGGRFADRWRAGSALLVAIALTIGLTIAGCGGGSSTSGSHTPTTFNATYGSFPDYLDPALSYSMEGWSAMSETYIPLLTYVHADGVAGTKVIPGLARAMPKITDGGRTYTLFLRPGLRYSDGTPVRATDFPATIERLLVMNSPASPFYESIVGAEKFAETKKGGISGIQADDKTGRIVIHLKEPRSTFTNELAMLFAAPLPAGTKREDLTEHPPPGTGPYEFSKVKAGLAWSYVRNPEWAKTNASILTGMQAGYYDRIDAQVMRNTETAVNDVISGKYDWMQAPVPPDRFQELRERYEGTQLMITPQIDIYYFWMNVNKAPFNDLRVRQAINYAIDPAVLERIYGGQMRALQQVLPVSMPGHKTFHPYPYDLKKAKELIAAADPTQRKVTVWTSDYAPTKESTEYYESVLRELGFEPTLKVIAAANYVTVIGNESTPNLDTGVANWFLDYPHPNDYFGPQLSGRSIMPTASSNYARFNDPAINRKIAELNREPLGPKQEAAYAQLDREVMAQAPWAPFGSLTLSTFVSSAIDLEKVIVSPVYGQDLASFRPKN